jgi:hypothetical protein
VAAVGGAVATATVEGRVHFKEFISGCGLSDLGALYCWRESPLVSRIPTPEPLLHLMQSLGYRRCGVSASLTGYCWTRTSAGETELGTVTKAVSFEPVPGNLLVRAVALGPGWHDCVLDVDGAAHCWGESQRSNTDGALGIGSVDSVEHLTPEPVVGGLEFSAIAKGSRFTCGLTVDQQVYCWGWGPRLFGYDASEVDDAYPEPLLLDPNCQYTAVTAGDEHACGLTTSQTAFCWGTQLPGPTHVAQGFTFSELEAGYGGRTCGLSTAGERVCWRWDGVAAIAGNTAHLRFQSIRRRCGRVEDGSVHCWLSDGELPHRLLFQSP